MCETKIVSCTCTQYVCLYIYIYMDSFTIWDPEHELKFHNFSTHGASHHGCQIIIKKKKKRSKNSRISVHINA
ncbi:hypothetical protein WN943_001153 [Citrus x changshan-huyou]